MRRGEVWVANLNPTRGREIGKVRPVVVMQADALGAAVTPLLICLPMTTQGIRACPIGGWTSRPGTGCCNPVRWSPTSRARWTARALARAH